ncbi:MAG: hypothetical protein NC040_06600 [Muribaculaceae bacterium]|nr:hypothetical protein [Alistipes senegalensis]MCM1473709.1 hypothetical protein [Muribaculaceae bacterium]
MKKFELTQTSDSICSTATLISIFWVILMFGVFVEFPNISTIVLMLIVPIFLIAVIIYCMGKKTIVEYNVEKIQWKWFRFTRTVKFNEMQYVYYTIIDQSSRYGHIRRLEIVFTMNNGEKLKLTDSLTKEDIENCISGTPNNIRLMQLYRFIEKFYPEKASSLY